MAIYSGFCPLIMVVFHSFLYVYQRVTRKIPGLIIPSSSMNFVGLTKPPSWIKIPRSSQIEKVVKITALLTTGMILQAVNEAIIYNGIEL